MLASRGARKGVLRLEQLHLSGRGNHIDQLQRRREGLDLPTHLVVKVVVSSEPARRRAEPRLPARPRAWRTSLGVTAAGALEQILELPDRCFHVRVRHVALLAEPFLDGGPFRGRLDVEVQVGAGVLAAPKICAGKGRGGVGYA